MNIRLRPVSRPASEKIADGVYYIPAKGHTTGNSIVIAEGDGIFLLGMRILKT